LVLFSNIVPVFGLKIPIVAMPSPFQSPRDRLHPETAKDKRLDVDRALKPVAKIESGIRSAEGPNTIDAISLPDSRRHKRRKMSSK